MVDLRLFCCLNKAVNVYVTPAVCQDLEMVETVSQGPQSVIQHSMAQSGGVGQFFCLNVQHSPYTICLD